jgi:BirA family biotin operon repressor/biotin-[acetyl-CoA-carboxylase] ligase
MLNKNELEIIKLLSLNDWVSGEKIAEELNISRTAVWKCIKKLSNFGYEIISVRKKGYQLLTQSKLHPVVCTLENISTCFGKIQYFKEIDSTQKETLRKIYESKHNILILTDKQTEGRGKENSKWPSPEGGLYFSIGLLPQYMKQKDLNTIIDIAKQGIKSSLAKYGIETEILGNSFLVNGKKIGGLLEEHFCEGEKLIFIVIGIGLYISAEDGNVTSISEVTGKAIDRWELLASFLELFCKKVKHSKGLLNCHHPIFI